MPSCPRCGSGMVETTRYRWRCRSCRYVSPPDHPARQLERLGAPMLPGFDCGNVSDTLAAEADSESGNGNEHT
jgi:hypothetical protein